MIRLKVKRDEQEKQETDDTNSSAAKNDGSSNDQVKKVKILGVGRGKKTGGKKEKKRTPGEIRIQKGRQMH